MTRIRQDPNDPCVLQYSNDGGLTWTDGFNYALCNTGFGDTTINSVTNQINLETQVNNYNQTVVNNYTSNGRDTPIYDALDATARKNALCFFIRQLVRGSISSFTELKEAQNEDFEKLPTGAALALGVASALLAIPTGGGSLLVWSALGTLAGSTALSAWLIYNDYDAGILADENALDAAACWLLDEWSNDIPSEAEFRSVDSSLAPSGIQDIVEVVSAAFDSVDVYANFLTSVNEASRAGSWFPQCACDAQWAYEWDFTISDGGWRVLTEDGKPYGNYVPGSGWHSVVGRGYHEIYISADFSSDILIDEIEQRLAPITTLDTGVHGAQVRLSGNVVLDGGEPENMANYRYRWSMASAGDQIALFSNNRDGASAEYICKSVRLYGFGPQPQGLSGGQFL